MQRRDAAVILWSIAGLYAIVSRYAREYLLVPLLGIAIGLAFFLGKQGVQQAWRALRSRSAPGD